jgi:hypothetical protein
MVSLTKNQVKTAISSYLNNPFSFENIRASVGLISVEDVTTAQHDPLQRFVYLVEFDRKTNENLLLANVGNLEWTAKYLGLKNEGYS